jgi:hypothetical protein
MMTILLTGAHVVLGSTDARVAAVHGVDTGRIDLEETIAA